MEWSEEGIVVGTRRHGEADVILEVLTALHGRHLGLVKGGRGRKLRPVLQPGNTLSLVWRARLHEHLGNFRAEPVTERSSRLMTSPIAAFGLALAGAHLRLIPERDPHPRLFDALTAMLDHLEEASLAAELMVRFELLLLDELGVGLDLETCAATGTREELIYVSPKSGRAVSRAAGEAYRDRLLALPAFLSGVRLGAAAGPAELDSAFRLTGTFLARHVHEPRGIAMPEARASFLRAIWLAFENAA
jgi:DNA repair protein RecO (recombination protein O)